MDALGDPTRRAILERLRGGPVSVGELASGLPVSRPAVSQHLRVLREAGLVTGRAVGTRRLYEIDRDVVERALALIDRAEYKRRQAPPGVKLRPKAFGRDRRTPITNRFQG